MDNYMVLMYFGVTRYAKESPDPTNARLKYIEFRALKLNSCESVTNVITFYYISHLVHLFSFCSEHKQLIPLNSFPFTCTFLVLQVILAHLEPIPSVLMCIWPNWWANLHEIPASQNDYAVQTSSMIQRPNSNSLSDISNSEQKLSFKIALIVQSLRNNLYSHCGNT